jgi:hypothetical protein
MQPIEEYGKGEGMEYGEVDSVTGQTYYGRGFVQLTWRDNYARADAECDFVGDDSCEWHAENALDPHKAARIMFVGMYAGWFREDEHGPENFERYFNYTVDDPYNAREIINGDKTKVPSWSNGVSIGNLIKGYHKKFYTALEAAVIEEPIPEPEPEPEPIPEPEPMAVVVLAPVGVQVIVKHLDADKADRLRQLAKEIGV